MIRLTGHIACLLALASIAGCASKPATTAEAEQGDRLRQSLASPDSGDILRKLTSAESGLELRKWIVQSDSTAVAEALARWQGDSGLDPQLHEQLQRNGFRLVRLPLEEADTLTDMLGGATLDVNVWHGQVLEWRELLRRRLPDEGLALAVDGRVRRVGRGSVGLVGRAWTVQLEDGPVVYLELVPRYHPPKSRDLRYLLGRDPEMGQPFPSLAMHVELEAGYAYVLIGESPQTKWLVAGGETSVDDEPLDTALTAVAPSALGPPVDPLGPGAIAPQTLGELMLVGQDYPPSRGMLVFVPRVPRDLYPPDHPALRPRIAAESVE